MIAIQSISFSGNQITAPGEASLDLIITLLRSALIQGYNRKDDGNGSVGI